MKRADPSASEASACANADLAVRRVDAGLFQAVAAAKASAIATAFAVATAFVAVDEVALGVCRACRTKYQHSQQSSRWYRTLSYKLGWRPSWPLRLKNGMLALRNYYYDKWDLWKTGERCIYPPSLVCFTELLTMKGSPVRQFKLARSRRTRASRCLSDNDVSIP